MLKFALTLVSVFILTGCALLNHKQQSDQVMAALVRSEQNLTETLSLLNNDFTAKISQQEYETKVLQEQLHRIEKKLSELSLSNNKSVANTISTHSTDVRFGYEEASNAGVKKTNNVKHITQSIDNPDRSKFNIAPLSVDAEVDVQSNTLILGAIETVYIEAIQSHFIARVDTGAATSSINAVDMQKFERNGKKWVKFLVSDDETAAQDKQWIEARIVRHVKIRQANVRGLERRPVIELWVKIGGIHEKAQFTLTDRTQMDYPLLLGREFIQDVAIVDVSKDFIQSKGLKSSTWQKLDNN